MRLDRLEKEAEDVLRRAKNLFRKVVVNFSGGKDSLVALDLATRIFPPGEAKIVFIEITGNSAECNTKYVRRIHEKHYADYELVYIRPPMDFFELMVRAGIPNPRTRWCMNKYKIAYLRKISPPFHVIGVKRADSRRRAQIYTKHIQKLKYGGTGIFPVLNWTTQDVYDYIKRYGLELSPCYKKYGSSGNCVFCPFAPRKTASLVLRDPYWREKILGALNQIRSLHDPNNKSRFKKLIIRNWLHNPVLYSNPITSYISFEEVNNVLMREEV